jgi:hypothetical protein
MNLEIHNDIKNKLDYFKNKNKIPNIIIHGPSGSGKKTILFNFINSIYDNDISLIKNYVININCAHGKGIKFIREELKFFAKTNVDLKQGSLFKSIILVNADKLTIDAQSALRRCIEVFSHSTRFFIIVEDKYKLLKPILSRFCEIFIDNPTINNKKINLHQYHISNYYKLNNLKKTKNTWIINQIKKCPKNITSILELTDKIYNKGYSGLDIIEIIPKLNFNEDKINSHLFCFYKIKKEFRNENNIIFLILNFILLSFDYNLENISII